MGYLSFGNIIGDKAHWWGDSYEHPCKLFIALVGKTAKARKGSSWRPIERLFNTIDPTWKITSGLSSGQGLIYAVRDKVEKIATKGANKGNLEEVDPGVSDKRVLFVEEEFSSILKEISREHNNLSDLLRTAWDKKNLDNQKILL